MGKRRVDGAVVRAVGVLNEGEHELVRLMDKLVS